MAEISGQVPEGMYTKLAYVVGWCLVNPKVKICTGTTVASIESVEDDMQDRVAVITDSDNSLPSLTPAKASMLETLACDVGDNIIEQQREQFHGLLVDYAVLFAESKLYRPY